MPCIGNNSTSPTYASPTVNTRKRASIHCPINVHVHIHAVCIDFQQRIAIFTSRCACITGVWHLRCRRLNGWGGDIPEGMQRGFLRLRYGGCMVRGKAVGRDGLSMRLLTLGGEELVYCCFCIASGPISINTRTICATYRERHARRVGCLAVSCACAGPSPHSSPSPDSRSPIPSVYSLARPYPLHIRSQMVWVTVLPALRSCQSYRQIWEIRQQNACA